MPENSARVIWDNPIHDATDLNPPMLDVAPRKLPDAENVDFAVADALELAFAEDEFDLMACQFGVMSFPDKVASFREAVQFLK